MTEVKEKVITLEIELPHEFRIVRYGNNDSLELECLENDYDIKNRKKLDTKSWKFAGYFTTVQSALRGYLNQCPKKRLVGKKKLSDVIAFLKDIEYKIEDISRDY